MSLRFFEESISTGSLPFVSEYLEKYPKTNGTILKVLSFTLVSSGKGYLIETDVCQGFMWKNSGLAKQVLEALSYYVQEQTGYQFYLKLDKDNKNKFSLAIEPEELVTWFGTEKKYGLQQSSSDLVVEQSNPYLLPVSTSQLSGENSQQKKKTGGQNGVRPLSPS